MVERKYDVFRLDNPTLQNSFPPQLPSQIALKDKASTSSNRRPVTLLSKFKIM
jgi:hypothetical protein